MHRLSYLALDLSFDPARAGLSPTHTCRAPPLGYVETEPSLWLLAGRGLGAEPNRSLTALQDRSFCVIFGPFLQARTG